MARSQLLEILFHQFRRSLVSLLFLPALLQQQLGVSVGLSSHLIWLHAWRNFGLQHSASCLSSMHLQNAVGVCLIVDSFGRLELFCFGSLELLQIDLSAVRLVFLGHRQSADLSS